MTATASPLPHLALVGDHDPAITAHRGIAASLQGRATFDWLMTDQLPGDATAMRQRLLGYDGVWCIPGSPFRQMDAALAAIRVAREDGLPFLGTCGGFQHAVIEYMRNVLGRAEADHAESNADTAMPVIAPLACSLVGQTGHVQFTAGSRLATTIGAAGSREGYHCSYGFNPAYRALLDTSDLKATAFDEAGEIRGAELAKHPFFIATLFQPERAALPADDATGGKDAVHPLVLAFIAAAAGARH
jgi:CTP synthase (UTP-ammonia lyase)